jgi:pSer/pThr/pTyr-binding forkhead associated (FHA) protein
MPLTGDLVVMGRGASCDIGLVSPEVAPVHCLLIYQSGAWRIRDCSGRATRVNGQTVQEEPLKNGDVIQVGTFSFEAHLPRGSSAPGRPAAGLAAPIMPSVERRRLQGSRRRLAERALHLRRQLNEARAAEADLARREQDLEVMVRRLRTAPPAAGVRKRPEDEPAEEPPRRDDEELVRRKGELDNFARAIRRQEQRLRDRERELDRQIEADRATYEKDLMRERVELAHDRQQLASMRAELEQRHATLEQTAALLEEEVMREREQIEQEREQLARERAYLDEQRKEVVQLRADLERRQAELPAQDGSASTHETRLDAAPDRLASARRLLRQLAERRDRMAPRPSGTHQKPAG